MTAIVGIDPSLTCTGVARLLRGTGRPGHDPAEWMPETWSRPSVGRRRDTLHDRKDRVVGIVADVLAFCTPCELAVIEAPAYGAAGGSAWDRAYVWWRIVDRLLDHEAPVVTVSPPSRALWATGNGRADKAAVSTAMGRMWPTAEIRNSDEGDALALASIGLHVLGEPAPFDLTAYRIRALTKVEVPDHLECAA